MIQIQPPFEGCFGQESGFRFAAGTTIHLVMGTNKNVVDRKSVPEKLVHPIEFTPALVASRETGLIGCYEKQKPSGFQIFQWFDRLLIDPKVLQGQGRRL